MHGPINVKSPNNTSKWQMGFNWAFKGLKLTLGNGLGKLYTTGCDDLYYWSRVDDVRKIRDRNQRTDIGKYSFVNRTIKNWNQLPAEALGTSPCIPKIFRKRSGKPIMNRVKRKK